MSKPVKIILHLNSRDQKELNYEVPDIQLDYQNLMGKEFTLPLDKLSIIETVRQDLNLPDGYLLDYEVTYKENSLIIHEADL